MIAGASRASRGNTMSGSSTDDNPPARPRPRNARGGGGGGESEGSEDEVTERGSEVCQIGDDMCTVPSELFNLPSLKGVLSLNTWNYCLTGSQSLVVVVFHIFLHIQFHAQFGVWKCFVEREFGSV